MNKRLQSLVNRPELSGEYGAGLCRQQEIRIVLGCAGVGATVGGEYEYLPDSQAFMAARQNGANLAEAITKVFPTE